MFGVIRQLVGVAVMAAAGVSAEVPGRIRELRNALREARRTGDVAECARVAMPCTLGPGVREDGPPCDRHGARGIPQGGHPCPVLADRCVALAPSCTGFQVVLTTDRGERAMSDRA